MPTDKEFGKLSIDQFRQIIQTLPEVRGQMKEMSEVIRSAPVTKLKEILDKDYYWAEAYEWEFAEQIAMLIIVLGKANELRSAVQQDDPQEALFQWLKEDKDEEWNGGEGGIFEKKHLVGLLTVLQKNILSIMLYHCTLSALVKTVRDGRDMDDDAYFKAVRVDRSILSCPTFSDRLAKAELFQDKKFFLRLRSALKGPSKKHWQAYQDLRYALAMLRDLGFDQLSDQQLEDLLVHKLKLYPDVPGARKNLRKQFTESKRVQPPQMNNSGGRAKPR